jgi:hypothetical protein
MNLPASIFLSIITLLIGVSIGSLIEIARWKRQVKLPSLPTSDVKLAQDGDVDVFSAWRTRNNKVWLNMDGKRLNSSEELLPEQRRRLLGLVVDLRPWLEAITPGTPEPEIPVQPFQPTAPLAGVPPQTVQLEKKKSKVSGEQAAPAPVLESIIDQIDKVLQTKLAGSPFRERGIHLTEGPGGIVIIKDGLKRYEGVEAIPDPQIQSLIRQAVSDWEKGTR